MYCDWLGLAGLRATIIESTVFQITAMMVLHIDAN